MEKNVFNQNQIEKIRFLQRLVRSFYVRRQFEQVRKEYLQTLSEIEGEPFVEEEKSSSNHVEPIVEEEKPSLSHVETIVEEEKEEKEETLSILTRDELLKKRDEIAIELVWLEQAIQSRKDYLRLKSRYTNSIRS